MRLTLALCKSSTLAFVLGFAFIFGLEKPGWKLVTIIATITVGVILMVATESQFELTGYPSPLLPIVVLSVLIQIFARHNRIRLIRSTLVTDSAIVAPHSSYLESCQHALSSRTGHVRISDSLTRRFRRPCVSIFASPIHSKAHPAAPIARTVGFCDEHHRIRTHLSNRRGHVVGGRYV